MTYQGFWMLRGQDSTRSEFEVEEKEWLVLVDADSGAENGIMSV